MDYSKQTYIMGLTKEVPPGAQVPKMMKISSYWRTAHPTHYDEAVKQAAQAANRVSRAGKRRSVSPPASPSRGAKMVKVARARGTCNAEASGSMTPVAKVKRNVRSPTSSTKSSGGRPETGHDLEGGYLIMKTRRQLKKTLKVKEEIDKWLGSPAHKQD